MRRFILHIALVLLFFTMPVQAAEVNKEGALRLKSLFTELLETQKTKIGLAGGAMTLEGTISIEQGSDYYAVTLPAMQIKGEDGGITKIGLIAINVTPTDLADEWKMSVALPNPISYEEADTQKITQLHIGEQVMSGIWNESLKNFSKLSARYNNIKVSHNFRQETLAINQLDIAVDLQEAQKGYWSGPTKFGVTGLSFGKPNAPRLAFAETIKFGITVDGFSPATQRDILQKISNNLAQSENGNEEEDTPNLFLMLLRHGGKSLNIQGAVSQLEVNTPIISGSMNRNFSLESGSFIFDMDGMRQGLVNQALKAAYRGLKIIDNKDGARDVLPKSFQINLALKNLPLTELFDVGGKLLSDEEQSKTAKQIATLQAMITLPQILSKAGTNISLSETKFGNDIYETTMDGILNASTKSLLGATGNLTMKTTGLDNLIIGLEEKSATALPANKSKIDKNLKRLKFIRKISQKQNEKYICRIDLSEKAKISINGADLDKLEKETGESALQ